MKKFVYILVFIIFCIPGAAYCLEDDNDIVLQDYDTFSNLDALLYFREAHINVLPIYLFLKPMEKTYELYSCGTEIGTWEKNKDTLVLTPRIAIDNRYHGWECVNVTDTALCDDDDMRLTKTFIIQDGGFRLLEITPYSIPSQLNDEYKLIGSNYLENYLNYLKTKKRREMENATKSEID